MMLARFFAGSIRRQIALLAIGPVVLFAILGSVSEHVTIKEPESVSQARSVAMRIEFVVDMLRSAETTGQKSTILDTVTKTGLQVEEVPAVELHGPEQPLEEGDFRLEIKTIFASHGRQDLFRDRDGSPGKRFWLSHLITIPPWLFTAARRARLAHHRSRNQRSSGDDGTSIVPVILLSLYGSRMIASPLLRFSCAAQDLDPDKGAERPFEEIGSLEVRTLAKSLNDMRSRIRAMIEARTRMLRAISHDLRTPLTRLRLRAERSSEPSLRNALLADIDALTLMVEETLVYLRKDISKENQLRADLPSMIVTACNDFADMGVLGDVSWARAFRLSVQASRAEARDRQSYRQRHEIRRTCGCRASCQTRSYSQHLRHRRRTRHTRRVPGQCSGAFL